MAAGRITALLRSPASARMRNRLGRTGRAATAVTRLHAALGERSGGRIRRSFFFLGGMPMLVLTTNGRRSGRPRSTPVGYLDHDGGWAVLAANGGNPKPPAWWLNLQANPRAEVLVEGRRYPVRARRAEGVEEDRLWATFAQINPAFAEYRKLTDRHIPVVLLERRDPTGG